MSLPHTLLVLACALGLGWAGVALSPRALPGPPPGVPVSPLALQGSTLGSLGARLLRDSLYSYWHDGEGAAAVPAPSAVTAAAVSATAPTPPPPPPAGRFARRGQAVAPPAPVAMPAPARVAAPEADLPWLDRQVVELARLEKQRTRRNSPFAPGVAHKRYLNASAGWRLRLAGLLDPGDPVIYEIQHFHLASQPRLPGRVDGTRALADSALAFALRDQAGLADTLTGAGAALNVLNDLLRPEATPRDTAAIARYRGLLELCLARHRKLRDEAAEAGWWAELPPVRQKELDDHAALLGRLAETLRRTPGAGVNP